MNILKNIIASSVVRHRFDTMDADAALFINNVGITDTAQKLAITTIVASSKAHGWKNQTVAVYPFVGGTADTHKYALFSPYDTDAGKRLTYIGTVNHDSGGMQSDGVSGYVTTYVNPSLHLQLNSSHLSFYSKTNLAEGKLDLGVATAGTGVNLWCRWSDNISYARLNSSSDAGGAVPSSIGFFMVSRIASNDVKIYRNGAQVATSASASVSLKNENIVFFRRSTGTYAGKKCAFATIGFGITAAMHLDMYNDIQEFQTILGRQE